MISNALIPGGVAIIHCAQIIARAFAFIRFTSCCCVILQDKKKKIYLVNVFNHHKLGEIVRLFHVGVKFGLNFKNILGGGSRP